jgi:hypothetical protein
VGVTGYTFETGGADNNRFSLNTTTGALTFISSPNFEAPGSAAGTNTYTVRVRASDAAGNTAVQTVTVNVMDLDEVLPVFTAGANANASIAENTPTSTVVHTASATDNVGVTAYAFESGGADNNRFSINTVTGALTFLSSPNFEAPGSAAGTNTYTVRVRASDAAGNTAVQTVTVNVTDLDEVVPVGVLTQMDNGDSGSNPDIINTNKDNNILFPADWDYYNNPAANANAASTPATASNTALHLVTNISAQTWEFHMANNSNQVIWTTADAQATDHSLWGSNTSRQASLAEAVALYAANFGGNNASGNTVGAVQPMSDVGSTNLYADAEDNRPGGWANSMWTAAPTPSGHARMNHHNGFLHDYPEALNLFVSAVL